MTQTIRAKVVDLSNRDRNVLFAVGNKQGQYYFIAPPRDPAAQLYYDRIRADLLAGNEIPVEITADRRQGTLIVPTEFEQLARQLGPEPGTPDDFETIAAPAVRPIPSAPDLSDTVTATIELMDLYGLIQPAKEEAFRKHGRICNWDYETKMAALKGHKPHQLLQDSRLSRDIVRIILDTGRPVNITGTNPEGWKGAELAFWGDKEVHEYIFLLKGSGLLDFSFNGCGPSYWAFESEYVLKDSSSGGGMVQSSFESNPLLRQALQQMLLPFQAELPSYSLADLFRR
jgi:hypothetical protein